MNTTRPVPSALVAALVTALAPGAAIATRGAHNPGLRAAGARAAEAPVVVELTPSAGSFHWSYSLTNRGTVPLEVVADRRLLRLDVTPAAPVSLPGARRRHARATVTRCAMPVRPSASSSANRVGIAPGGTYREGFDVRELCGLHPSAALAPGATVTLHYGFPGRASFARTVVLETIAGPFSEIADAPRVLPAGTWPAPTLPAPGTDGPLQLAVSGDLDGETAMAVNPTVRLSRTDPYPLLALFRAGTVGFDVRRPDGHSATCPALQRGYAPLRENFSALSRGRSARHTVQLGVVCARTVFELPGIYRVQALYSSRVEGSSLGLRSFTGELASPYAFVRITRGERAVPYRAEPVDDPFAAAPPSGDARGIHP